MERHLLEKIWSDAARKTFRGVPAFALSADWEFLYLAVHAARHGLLSVKWFVDLDRLSWRGMIDWEKVGQKARSLGWEDAVRFSLSACRSLFDTPVSPAFRSVAAPRAFCAQHPSDLKVPADFLFSLRLLKTPSQKLRYAAIRLFVPTQADCRFLALPISLFFLYYPLRPLRVACETVGWLVQAGLKSLWRTLRRPDAPHQSTGV